jgi:hypothetical protein
MVGAAWTVTVEVLLEFWSLSVTVTVKLPVEVGVPVTVAVEESPVGVKVNPAGRPGAVHVYGAVPPLTDKF